MSQLKTDRPTVTIGMPIRNCEATLAQAIRSLQMQTFRDWNLIMIDDGSTDRTVEVARRFSDERITILVDGMHRGLPARLNQILSLTNSPYFGRMDADDISYPQRLERQVQYLDKHPEIDLIGCSTAVFGREGTLLGKRQAPDNHAGICKFPHSGFSVAHPTFVGRLGWFRRFHYRESAIRCEDQDLLLRSYRFSQFGNIPEILLGYREETINLRKILTSRWYLGIAFAHEFSERREYGIAIWALLVQAAKASVDLIAVASGLQHRLLRHRARPVSSSERSKWEEVWGTLTGSGARDPGPSQFSPEAWSTNHAAAHGASTAHATRTQAE
jgi:glycosyltransferase involved in cell wall biosynthesis